MRSSCERTWRGPRRNGGSTRRTRQRWARTRCRRCSTRCRSFPLKTAATRPPRSCGVGGTPRTATGAPGTGVAAAPAASLPARAPRCAPRAPEESRRPRMVTDGLTPFTVLLFAGAVLAGVTLIVVHAIARIMKREPLARITLRLLLGGLGAYVVLFLGASLTSRDHVLPPGEEKHICEIDCHLAYSVVATQAGGGTWGGPPVAPAGGGGVWRGGELFPPAPGAGAPPPKPKCAAGG